MAVRVEKGHWQDLSLHGLSSVWILYVRFSRRMTVPAPATVARVHFDCPNDDTSLGLLQQPAMLTRRAMRTPLGRARFSTVRDLALCQRRPRPFKSADSPATRTPRFASRARGHRSFPSARGVSRLRPARLRQARRMRVYAQWIGWACARCGPVSRVAVPIAAAPSRARFSCHGRAAAGQCPKPRAWPCYIKRAARNSCAVPAVLSPPPLPDPRAPSLRCLLGGARKTCGPAGDN